MYVLAVRRLRGQKLQIFHREEERREIEHQSAVRRTEGVRARLRGDGEQSVEAAEAHGRTGGLLRGDDVVEPAGVEGKVQDRQTEVQFLELRERFHQNGQRGVHDPFVREILARVFGRPPVGARLRDVLAVRRTAVGQAVHARREDQERRVDPGRVGLGVARRRRRVAPRRLLQSGGQEQVEEKTDHGETAHRRHDQPGGRREVRTRESRHPQRHHVLHQIDIDRRQRGVEKSVRQPVAPLQSVQVAVHRTVQGDRRVREHSARPLAKNRVRLAADRRVQSEEKENVETEIRHDKNHATRGRTHVLVAAAGFQKAKTDAVPLAGAQTKPAEKTETAHVERRPK